MSEGTRTATAATAADLSVAVEAARAAGARVRAHYAAGVERLTKTHAATTDEAVTIADREAQAVVVDALRKHFPHDGIIGEESEDGSSITADIRDPYGRNWVIDPIDGTNNFIAGLGNFAVCIGLLIKGEAVLGVVYDVARDELYSGGIGLGVTVNDVPVSINPTALSPASLMMLTSNLLDKNGRQPKWAAEFLAQNDLKVRILGTAALEAVAVAAGVAHGAITVNGKLWDCVAPAALVLAGGGIVTDFAGEPIFPYDVTNYAGAKVPFLAATASAHADLLKRLQEA